MNFRIRFQLPLAIAALLAVASLPAQDDETEKEAKAIENLLIAPCCWRQPVDVHESPASSQIRREIREMLAKGMTRDEILQAYVDSYGQRILSAPPARGFYSVSYALPFVALLAGAWAVLLFFRRHRLVKAPDPPRTGVPGKYAELLKREVED